MRFSARVLGNLSPRARVSHFLIASMQPRSPGLIKPSVRCRARSTFIRAVPRTGVECLVAVRPGRRPSRMERFLLGPESLHDARRERVVLESKFSKGLDRHRWVPADKARVGAWSVRLFLLGHYRGADAIAKRLLCVAAAWEARLGTSLERSSVRSTQVLIHGRRDQTHQFVNGGDSKCWHLENVASDRGPQ
jgi:hypothetical protein